MKKNILVTLIIMGVIYSCASPVEFKDAIFKPLTSISITPESASTITTDNGSLTLKVTYVPEEKDVTAGAAVNWSTSDATVATVAGGKVTALSNGTATITATSTLISTITATFDVVVTGQTVDLVDQFKILAVQSKDQKYPLGTTFESNLVKAKLLGSTTTANSLLQSGRSLTLFVPVESAWKEIDFSLLSTDERDNIVKYHVVESAARSNAFAASYVTMYGGATPDNNIYIAGGKVSNKAASPEVEATILSGKQPGDKTPAFPDFTYNEKVVTSTIVLHFIDKLLIPSSMYSKLSKTKGYPTGVEITTPEAGRVISTRGGKLNLAATVQPAATAWQGITWTISDSSIASIAKLTGELTAKKNGEVTVTATVAKGSEGTGKHYSATATVTITNNFSSHSINGGITEASITQKGAYLEVSVNAVTGENVVWTIDTASRDLVGLFNAAGAGTAAANGTKTVTGTTKISIKAIADFNGTATLTAKPANGSTLPFTVSVDGQVPPDNINISGVVNAYKVGFTTTLTASVRNAGNSSKGVDQRVTWSTSSATFATISTAGKVEMKATGNYDGTREVTFTATSTVNSSVTATHKIEF